MCISSLFALLWGAGHMSFKEVVLINTLLSLSLFGIALVLYGRRLTQAIQ
jgi:hypothetical protein